MFESVSSYFESIQKSICTIISKYDGNTFIKDKWTRKSGGGGLTSVLKGKQIFEKAGVNISKVHGNLSKKEQVLFSKMMKEKGIIVKNIESASFFATGISIIIHPYNPFVPAIHANYRYFELKSKFDFISWFGGGSDLTPYYYFQEDENFFHNNYKKICDSFDINLYNKFKQNCDKYFFLPHRNEYRGIGGIFFDYLHEPCLNSSYEFVKKNANSFTDIYLSIVTKRKDHPFNQKQKQWQKIRRGRYVEFNLLYDKGTKFGLETKGRTESIFVSLPPDVKWDYEFKVLPNSAEKKLLDRLTPKSL